MAEVTTFPAAMRRLGPFLPAPIFLLAALIAGKTAAPPAGATPVAAGERALALARAITACGPHPPGTPCHETARRTVHEALASIGVPVRVERLEDDRGPLLNLLARIPGSGAAPGRIVIGAHYDSVPAGPGAVDDAGAAAVAVETARLLRATPAAHEVEVAIFDGEESGLRGSARHVQMSTAADRDTIVAAVMMEMVGWPGEIPVTHTFRNLGGGASARAGAPGWLVDAVAAGGRAAGIEIPTGDPLVSLPYQLTVRNARVPFAADDFPFLAAGVPALFVSGSSFVNFYPAYHSADDTPARLAVPELARAVTVLEGIVRALDSRAPAPRAYGDDQALLLSGALIARPALLFLLALAAVPALFHARRRRAALLAALAAAGLALGGAAIDALTVVPLCAPALWVGALRGARARPARWLATAIALAAPLGAAGLFLAAAASYPGTIALAPFSTVALVSAGASLVALFASGSLSRRRDG